MPNIRSQEATPTSLTITASDGRSYTATRDDVIAYYASLGGGSVASRRAATIAEFKRRISAALGPEQVPVSAISLDFDWAGANTQIFLSVTD